jgi:tetratricopeptide (TPR) repeat protein
MEVDGNVDAERVTEQEARAELDRLLSDPQFHLTERHRNFLNFVAREMFEGRAATVKAYTIAVDVFGRLCDFDPINDPIVRIEATRLRASLAQYYEAHAEEGRIRIELPRGKYVPVFTKVPRQEENFDDADAFVDIQLKGAYPRRQNVITRRRLVVSAIVAAVALGIWFSAVKGPVFSQKPLVTIEMTLAGDGTDAEARLIRDYLMVALSQFQTLRLAAEKSALPDAGDRQSIAGISFFESGRHTARHYRVLLKYHPSEAGRSLWWQIVDSSTGEALHVGVEQVFLDNEPDVEVRRELVAHLAIRFAETRGVINTLELKGELVAPTIGNGCLLRSALAMERHDADELREARACLDATLLALPNDPDVNAELAIALLESEQPEVLTASTARALALADRSVALDPLSARAGYAKMLAQFRNGQTEAAFVSGYRAMALNPNNGLITARLGAMLFAQGRWSEGTGLAIKASMIEHVPHSDAAVTIALDAYRRGEFAQALLRVQQMGQTDDYVANVIALAASGQLGKLDSAMEAAIRLKVQRQHFQETFRADMTARQYTPVLIDQLASGLMKAGSDTAAVSFLPPRPVE